MSKYLGKLLIEAKVVDPEWLESGGGLCVKYVKGRDMFLFRIGGGEGEVIAVGAELCLALARIIGMLDFQYKWSVGYKVKEKRGVEELKSLRDEELNQLGGRKELILSAQLDNDDDFDILCAIQYLYKLSETFLLSVKRSWRSGNRGCKWKQLPKRILDHGGRKKGSKNLVKGLDSEESETLEEMLARCEHNMKAGLAKGFYAWFEEGYKEKCRILGQRFDKDKCWKLWNEEIEKRAEVE